MYNKSKPIKPYTFIYYIKNHRFEIGFSASSQPLYKITSVRDTSGFFEDSVLSKQISKKIQGLKNKNLIKLMLELNKVLNVECMGFNHNA